MKEYLYFNIYIDLPALFFSLLYMKHQNLQIVVFPHQILDVFYLLLFDKQLDVFSIKKIKIILQINYNLVIGYQLVCHKNESRSLFYEFLSILSIITDNEIRDEKKKHDHLIIILKTYRKNVSFHSYVSTLILSLEKKSLCPQVIYQTIMVTSSTISIISTHTFIVFYIEFQHLISPSS